MQLSYRGVKYNTSDTAAKVIETSEVGQYRGATYHIRQAVNVPSRRSQDVLTYRGAVVR